jgi:predicted DNA-binding transcriptional regulator AlpA
MTRALLGLSAIARRLHISRQRIYVLAMHADFPAPAHELETGRVWAAQDVEQWIAAHPQYDHSGDEAAA